MSGGPPDLTDASDEQTGEHSTRSARNRENTARESNGRPADENAQPRTLPASQNSRRERALPSSPAALGAFIILAALTALCLAWEWRIAPLRPGGSALVLKALPLAAALPGVFRRRLYTFQWASMLVLLYFAEGIVRGMTDPAPGDVLGWIEVGLSLAFFGCALAYVAPFKRAARRAKRDAA
jgi:uncharacterized membrane protein